MSSYKEIWDLRITCADEDLFPPLERNYSCATECARFYGMPVRRFYKDRERYEGDDEPYVIWNGALDRESSEDDELYDMEEDEVWLWRVLLVSDTHIAAMPPEIFEQQDMLLVYRTASEGEFIESVQPLLARQTDEFYRHLNNPDIFCFDDADYAKDFVHWFGLWWGKSCYEDMRDLDYSKVKKTLASQDGKIRCVSEAGKLPVQDETVEGVLISFGVDEEHSFIADEMLEWWDISEQEDELFDYISEKVQEMIPCFPTARFIWTVRAGKKCEEVVFIAREIVKGLKIMPHIALQVASIDESLFPVLEDSHSSMKVCDAVCGMPVRNFYKDVDLKHFLSMEDDGWYPIMILLVSDEHAVNLPADILWKQDMICIYRTSSEKILHDSMETMLARRKNECDGHVDGTGIFCFADVACAKDFIRWVSIWNIQEDYVGLDYMDFSNSLGSQEGNIRCISEAFLLRQEKMPEEDITVQGVYVGFGITKQDDMIDVLERAELINKSFPMAYIVSTETFSEKKEEVIFIVRQLISTSNTEAQVLR